MQVNPFWPTFAVDPRKVETAWRPRFAETLQRISSEFEQRFPNRGSSWPHGEEWQQGPLLLFGSSSGGGGTTTLLGTLFRLMEGRALPIYIRPFRNPLAPWKALLRALGEELRLPDRPRAIHPWPEEPSRIQVFANDILGSLASQLVSQGRIRDSRLRSAVRFLRRHPSKVLLEGLVPEWAQWLRQDFARIVPSAEALLSELGPWGDHLQNWLWAIHGLAVRTEDRVVQEACRHWIFGEPLDWAQAIRANLSVTTRDPATEAFAEEEGLCRRRVEDLLRLSRLSRPFLFAFDNADAWGTEPALASAAGHLLEALSETSPAFLLLGAHLRHWNESVLPYWSDKQRNLLSPLLPLAEVVREEAVDLLEERLWRFEGRKARLRPEWVESSFQSRSTLPLRSLLLSCASHWNEEHSIDQEASSASIRWLHDAKLQWEMAAPHLPCRWISEWALLPLEPPADFPWKREEAGAGNLFCARRKLPETDLFLFPQARVPGTDARAFLTFLEKAEEEAKACGRTLEPFSLIFEREESRTTASRGLPEQGLPGLSLLRVSTAEMIDLAAAVSLSFSFRREEGCLSVEKESHDRAQEILAAWRSRLPLTGPVSETRRKGELLSLPLIEAVRDTVRAKRVVSLKAVLQSQPRQISREQALSAAGILSEVQVRTGSSLEPLFCWQG